jgi:hypothetical protein
VPRHVAPSRTAKTTLVLPQSMTRSMAPLCGQAIPIEIASLRSE